MNAVLSLRFLLIHNLVSTMSTQAPGDADLLCLTLSDSVTPLFPQNSRILMDSYQYIHLLPLLPDTPAVWQQVDVDNRTASSGGRTNWFQASSFACRQRLSSCYFDTGGQNNWLITQHISRVVNGSLLPQVKVQIEFQLTGCTCGCQVSFLLEVWETSTIDKNAARVASNYRRVARVAPTYKAYSNISQNASIPINFQSSTASGFFIAIVDENTCMSLTRVIVLYHVCPEMILNLVRHPETLSPPVHGLQPFFVNGKCVDGASGELQGRNPQLYCHQGGVWGVVQEGTGCVCNSGYMHVLENNTCLKIEMTTVKAYSEAPELTISETSSTNLRVAVILPSFSFAIVIGVIILIGILLSYFKHRIHRSSSVSEQVYDVPYDIKAEAIKTNKCEAYAII